MTFNELIENILVDIDEENSDSALVTKLKKFVNRAYKELAKKERLTKVSNVTFEDGYCRKPSNALKVYNVIINDDYLNFSEEGKKIKCNYEGEAELLYSFIPDDLEDEDDEPLTNKAYDEYLMNYAKYLYFMSDMQVDFAKLYKMECDSFKVLPKANSVKTINVYGGF